MLFAAGGPQVEDRAGGGGVPEKGAAGGGPIRNDPARSFDEPYRPGGRIRILRDGNVDNAVERGVCGRGRREESSALQVVQEPWLDKAVTRGDRVEGVEVGERLAHTGLAPGGKVAFYHRHHG